MWRLSTSSMSAPECQTGRETWPGPVPSVNPRGIINRSLGTCSILALLLLSLAGFSPVVLAQDQKDEDLSGKVSIESIILDAAAADPSSGQTEPVLDKLARNVKDLLLKLKDYKQFDTRFYDLDNVAEGSAFAPNLKKNIPGMSVTVTPGKPEGEKFRFTLEWKQQEKVILKQTNVQVDRGKWYVKAFLREDGNSYLLLVRVSDAVKDLKAERKKRGLPEVKKEEDR